MVDQRMMAEATRLTRAGRLAEATALLQGGGAPAPSPSDQAPDQKRGTGPGATAKQRATRVGHGLGAVLRGLKTARPGRAARPAIIVPPGARWTRHTASAAGTTRDYALFEPSAPRLGPDLVIMLHGCTQNADDFAVGTRINEHAERHGFLVAYPEQPQAANQNGCWNWFETGHQALATGEPAIVCAIVEAVRGRAPGLGRVFVAGLSAGGAMAANLAAMNPEWLDGAAVHSGLSAGAASGLPQALSAMGGKGGAATPNPEAVPMLIIHGDADRTVAPANAEGLVRQALGPARQTMSETETVGDAGRTARITRERLADGTVICELVTVPGGGHAWFGGDAAGSYTAPGAFDASAALVRFFGLDRNDYLMA